VKGGRREQITQPKAVMLEKVNHTPTKGDMTDPRVYKLSPGDVINSLEF
jgi:hypothetical protein